MHVSSLQHGKAATYETARDVPSTCAIIETEDDREHKDTMRMKESCEGRECHSDRDFLGSIPYASILPVMLQCANLFHS